VQYVHAKDDLLQQPRRHRADDDGVAVAERIVSHGDAGADAAEVHDGGGVAELLGGALQVAHVPAVAAGEDGEVHPAHSSPKNDRANTSGITSPKAWLLPLLRLQNTTSAGLNSSGSIL